MESIQALVQRIKGEIFSSFDPYSFVSPSAYDTAWLAMIPDPEHPDRPLFPQCVDWILQNQHEDGFWSGETEGCNPPTTLECLPATLACMAALKRWNVGSIHIEIGLGFAHANTEELLKGLNGHCPFWFAVVFPAMVELVQSSGLDVFPNGFMEEVETIFSERERILEMKRFSDQAFDPPLMSFMEALPVTYVNHEQMMQHQRKDGSLFQSPSATAYAFMVTGNEDFRLYLESIFQRCNNGVPPMYPIDEELVELCLVNRLERMGLAEHFPEEIEQILQGVYRNWKEQETEAIKESITPQQIFKDSLAFRLLRLNGHRVSPRRFCWYSHHSAILKYMEENWEYFLSSMLNVHRATDLMFKGESELQDARTSSRKLLEKAFGLSSAKDCALISNFQKEIKHELELPWLARLDHLEHRVSVEGSKIDYLWIEKASYYRLSFMNNAGLLQLAEENYAFRQSIFVKELRELKRWSQESGLGDIGFGRNKTVYCYFAVSAIAYNPSLKNLRMFVAKSAILITIIDDFFDMQGSVEELIQLTDAIQRWHIEGLDGPSKVIFRVLNDLVCETSYEILNQQGYDVTDDLRHMWHETVMSWLKEAEWSRKKMAPSVAEYVETGMISIAAHVMVLPSIYLMSPRLPKGLMKNMQYESITKLLMLVSRLLNDTQSYQKELEDGKLNMVSLYMRENPWARIEDSISFVREVIEMKQKELLELVLIDDLNHVPKRWKQLNLSCMRVFQMFFNSTNGYDSPTEMLDNIDKAIFAPLRASSQFIPKKQAVLPKKKLANFEPRTTTRLKHDDDKISASAQMQRVSKQNLSKRSQPMLTYNANVKPLVIRRQPECTFVTRRFLLRSYTRGSMTLSVSNL